MPTRRRMPGKRKSEQCLPNSTHLLRHWASRRSFGFNPARSNCVHANIILPVVSRERSRQSDHCRFRRRVDGHAAHPGHPRHGREIQDYAAAFGLHSRQHGLGCEERMPQIDGNTFVEHLRRHLERPMTLVVCGIIDEDVGSTERTCERCNTRPQSINVPNISLQTARPNSRRRARRQARWMAFSAMIDKTRLWLSVGRTRSRLPRQYPIHHRLRLLISLRGRGRWHPRTPGRMNVTPVRSCSAPFNVPPVSDAISYASGISGNIRFVARYPARRRCDVSCAATERHTNYENTGTPFAR